MMNDQSPATRFCHQCGRQLEQAEVDAGYICAECQGKQDQEDQRGLLPGKAWTNAGGARGGSMPDVPGEPASPTGQGAQSGESSPLNSESAFQSGSLGAYEALSAQSPGESTPDTHGRSSSQPGDALGGLQSAAPPVERVGGDGRGVSGQGAGGREAAPEGGGTGNPGPGSTAGAGGPYSRALWPPPGPYYDYGRSYGSYPPPENAPTDPDNPPWKLLGGFGVWLFSVAGILVLPTIGAFAFIVYEEAKGVSVPLHDKDRLMQFLLGPSSVLVQVLSLLVAHALTLLVVWAVVTRIRRWPFFRTLGFEWDTGESLRNASFWAGGFAVLCLEALLWSGVVDGFRGSGATHRSDAIVGGLMLVLIHILVGVVVWAVVTERGLLPFLIGFTAKWTERAWLQKLAFILGIVAAMLVVDIFLSNVLPKSRETDFDKIVRASQTVRIVLAAIAVLSAPIVEEAVYRGVLYSCLRRVAGMWPSILIVTLFFGGVHFPQYWGSWVALSSIMVLSLTLTVIRAKTKSLLPCFIIHTLYNLIGAIAIVGHGGK